MKNENGRPIGKETFVDPIEDQLKSEVRRDTSVGVEANARTLDVIGKAGADVVRMS